MKIPKKSYILVSGRKFKLKNNLSEDQIKKLINDGSCPFGATNYSERVIAVREHKNKDEQVITYIHELLHVALIHSGLCQVISPELQEIICESGANAVFDGFK
jgi:Zn-dependent peptidase ImmA (M78 family)